MRISIDTVLADDLIGHLEHVARGGMPNPELAASLLRRLKSAVIESQRGFTPPKPDESLYRNAPPPAREPA